MILRNCDGIEWLEFELLADFKEVIHGIFLRKGGHSESPYDSLNFSFEVGDDPSAVAKNEKKVQEILGVGRFVRGKLVHGTCVVSVEEGDIGPLKGDCDGLLTVEKGVGLLTTHADCQACLLYDPVKNVVGNVHCGWRGNVTNIYREAIEKMQLRYGCRPADILACISPSLGPCHSEFVNYREELPTSFLKYQVAINYFDFWAVAEEQLTALGLLPFHIEIAEVCTYSNVVDFYSYRREKICGRHGAVICLR